MLNNMKHVRKLISSPSSIGKSLYRKIVLLGLTLSSLIILSSFLIWGTLANLLEEEQEIYHLNRELYQLKNAMLNQETGQRGYNLSENEDFLEVFYRGIQQFNDTSNLLLDVPLSTELHDELVKLITYGEVWTEEFALPQIKTNDVTIENLQKGKMMFDTFRVQFHSVEALFRDRYENQMNSFEKRIQLLLIGISLFLIVLLTFIIYNLYRGLRNFTTPLTELTTCVAHYENQNFKPRVTYKKHDELGALINGVNHLGQELQEKFLALQYREELLTMQNEELQSQQDELSVHQDKLQASLNELNNVNSALNESAIVVITDEKGKIIFVNNKFCEVSKYSKEELVGKDHRVINSGYHSKEFFQTLWKTINNGEIWKGEIRNKAKDGSFYWVDTTIVPYLDQGGKPYQFIAIRKDITNIKNVEQELKQSLELTEKTKNTLYNHNRLNHALGATLNKKELLDSIIENVTKIYRVDKALIVLLYSKDQYASIGVSTKQAKAFIQSIDESLMIRLAELNQPHIVHRKAHVYEQGYHEEAISCYDLYLPIFSANGQLVSLLIMTRIGTTFTDNELDELKGVMYRVSTSLEKIALYEEADKSRKLNQDIIDNVDEGIQFVDKGGNIIQINKKLCQFIDCTDPESILNASYDTWSAIFRKMIIGSNSFLDFIYRSIFFGENGTFRYEIEQPEKRIIDVYTETIKRGDQTIGTLIVHRDITVEFEVDQMKSELVSTVSHELRTPLASVLGYTELILARELKPEKQKKYIETIHKEAHRLTNIINDFLDLQRMELGKQVYEKRKVDLLQCVNEVVESFMDTNQNHVFTIDTRTDDAMVYVDYAKIIQLLTNLIGNAVKFSPNGGEVKVSVTQNNEMLGVSISDQGVGIAKEEIPKLFKKFYRSNNTDRYKIGGTGLGLSICKEIVEAHGGQIIVESRPESGSTFTFTIPVIGNSDLVQPDEYKDKLSKKGYHVVIIEDDISLAQFLKEGLEVNDYDVTHFVNGKQAISYIERNHPAIVVIDIMLDGGMDGWEIIRHLKNNDRTKHIPIFISSALDEKEKSKLSGVLQYLTKPYPMSDLVKAIDDTLKQDNIEGEILILDQEKP